MKKRLISLMLCMILCLSLLPMSVFAEGVTTYTEVVGLWNNTPEADAVPSSCQPVINDDGINTTMGRWYVKVGEEWEEFSGSTFTTGSYYYLCQLRCKSSSDILTSDAIFKVDGQEWINMYDAAGFGKDTYWHWYRSPEINIVSENKDDLVCSYKGSIPESGVGHPIIEINLKEKTIGNQPFVFSKISGPDWIKVSEDGIISGTPVSAGNNSDLMVKISDKYYEITVTIPVGETIKPNVYNKIEAHWTGEPEYGESLQDTGIEFDTDGIYNAGTQWQRLVSDNWTTYRGSVFIEGTYSYVVQVRCSSVADEIPEDAVFTVNGTPWTRLSNSEGYGSEYYWCWYRSPLFTMESDGQTAILKDVNFGKIGLDYSGRLVERVTFSNMGAVGMDMPVVSLTGGSDVFKLGKDRTPFNIPPGSSCTEYYIYVDEGVPAGKYEAEITLTSTNFDPVKARVTLKVYDPANPYTDGEWVKSSKGWWYKCEDGEYPADGIYTIDGVNYAFNADGYMVTGWYEYDGNWYHFASSGAMEYGWQKINNKWYYFDPSQNGVMLADGIGYIDGNIYCLNASGAMQTGWIKYYDYWYYFASSGAMQFGWLKDGGKWYYLDPDNDGAMVSEDFCYINGKYYYFNASGVMQTGWIEYDDHWFFLSASGAMVTAAWEGNYYLDANGFMVKSSYIKNGDKYYWVNKDGKYTKTYSAEDVAGDTEVYDIYDQATGMIPVAE